MRPSRRSVVRLLAVLGIAVGMLAPQPATAAELSPAAQEAFSDIAGCISTADNVLISIVVDESLSLRDTDPTDLRVRGITTAVDSLEQLADSVAAGTRVHVSLSTFARSFDTVVGWKRLGPGTADELRATAQRTLPEADTGNATDYRQALQGAQRQLDDQQRKLDDPDACKVLLWFTDGALDVDAETDAAATELCQVGGIADALRSDGIAVVALALFTPGAGVTDAQREQLRSVAEGKASGTSCGDVPIPRNSAKGVYLPADDPAALQQLFAGAGTLVGGGSQVGTVSCPGAECPNGTYTLALDPGIAGARVLVTSASTPELTLTSPSGDRVKLREGATVTVDGAEVTYLVRDQLATLDIGYPSYTPEPVQWRIRPAGPSDLSVYWFWGAQLQLDLDELQAGERNDLRLRLLDQTGEPLSPRLFDGLQVDLRVGDRPVRTRIDPDGVIAGALELPVEDLPPSFPVTATLTATSSPTGTALGPVTLSERVPVALPPSYPAVGPDEVDFGHLEGLGTATGELTLTGSRLGPTKVCLAESSVTIPGNTAADDAVTAGRRCVDLAADETKTTSLELTPDATADGVATGEVVLTLEPADGSEPLQVAVPLRLDMERPVDEGTRWLLVAVLVALALLVPLALLVLSNLWLARFVMTSTSRTVAKPVRVTPEGLAPLTGELIEWTDLQNAGFSGRRRARRMQVDGTGVTLRARRIVSLLEPVGVAVGPEGRILVSARTPYRGKRPHEAPAALGEVDAGFVILDPGTPTEVDGMLVLVVPEAVSFEGVRDRARRLSNDPDWAKLLAEAAERQPEPVPAGRAAAGTTERPAETAPVDEPLDTPTTFAWDTPTSYDPPPSSQPSGRTKRRRSEPPPPSTSSGDDDDLPPLPDFLK